MSEYACHPAITRMYKLCNNKAMSIDQNTYEWLCYRNRRITSTDCHTVIVGNPELLAKSISGKIRRLQSENPADTGPLAVSSIPSIRFGHDHESEAAMMYAQSQATALHKVGLAIHPQFHWLAASPDRIDPTRGRLIEIKCAYSRIVPASKIPKQHWIQMQIAMACTGVHICDYVEYSKCFLTRRKQYRRENDGACIFIRRVHFDMSWFAAHVENLYNFYCSFARQAGIDILPFQADDIEASNARACNFHERPSFEEQPVQHYHVDDLRCYETLDPTLPTYREWLNEKKVNHYSNVPLSNTPIPFTQVTDDYIQNYMDEHQDNETLPPLLPELPDLPEDFEFPPLTFQETSNKRPSTSPRQDCQDPEFDQDSPTKRLNLDLRYLDPDFGLFECEDLDPETNDILCRQ